MMKTMLIIAMTTLLFASANAQDTTLLSPVYSYGFKYDRLLTKRDLILPIFGRYSNDTTTKILGNTRIIGTKLYYVGTDGWWHSASAGGSGSGTTPTLSEVLTSGNNAPSQTITAQQFLGDDVTTTTGNIGTVISTEVNTNDANVTGTLTATDIVASNSIIANNITSDLFTGDGSGLYNIVVDTFSMATRRWRQKGIDSVIGLISATTTDTFSIATRKWRQKGIDSVVALIPVVGGLLSTSDSTIYSTKANATKQRDSVVALIPSLTGYLRSSDSTIYSTKANATKQRDSVVALIPSLAGYLRNSDSTIYSTKANATKQRDSVVALIPSLTGYLRNSDSTIYSTKANATKQRDSVVALIPSLTGYLRNSDSTIYSTKANATKQRDSVVTLINTNSNNILLKKSISDSGYSAGPQAYASVALLKKTSDSMSGIITNLNNWSLVGNSVSAGTQFIGSTNNVSLRFRTNNTQQMMLDSLGRLLLGATAPIGTEQLSVQKDQNAATRLTISNSTSGTAAQSAIYLQSNSSTGLDINVYSSAFSASGSALPGIARVMSNTANGFILGTQNSAPLSLRTGGSERWRVDINGNFTNASTTGATSALIDVQSATKGVLLPRMTKTQRDAISSPATGLIIFQTDNTPGIRVYNGTNWMRYTETTD